MKKTTVRHIIIKLLKIKDKEKNLKSRYIHYMQRNENNNIRFLVQNNTIEKRMDIFKIPKEKNCQPRMLKLEICISKTKSFSDTHKWKEIMTNRPALQEMLRDILQA